MKLKTNYFALTIISIILVISGCKGKKKNELETMRSETDTLRILADNFMTESGTMYYENWVEGKNLKLVSLYKKYNQVFDAETIILFNKLLNKEQRKERVGKLNRFKTFVYNEIVNKHTIKLQEEIENLKSNGRVKVDSSYYPFYSMFAKMSNESRPKQREKYYKSTAEFLEKVNPVYRKRIEKNIAMTDTLGFRNFIQFSEMIRDLNFTQFRGLVEGYLNSTNDIYFNLLTEVLRTNKISPDNFYRSDFYKILRNDKFDKFFKKDSLAGFWKRTFSGMGFTLDSIKNLKIDMSETPDKNPRAVCFPVTIPGDIRMSIKPTGGYQDFASLFHESGHGLHFALTTEKDFEFKYLNNNAMTESYSFLFEHLLDEPLFLKNNLQMKDPEIKSFIKFRAFKRLYMTRRYCAKFLYELQLYDSLDSAPKKYSELLSNVLGYKELPADANFYLYDVDDYFYVVDYLRAWFIEAMFKTVLREKFGEEWFNNPSTGEYLTEFFATGQRYTVEEFVKNVGFTDIDPKFLYNEIDYMLKIAKGN